MGLCEELCSWTVEPVTAQLHIKSKGEEKMLWARESPGLSSTAIWAPTYLQLSNEDPFQPPKNSFVFCILYFVLCIMYFVFCNMASYLQLSNADPF